MCAMKVMKSKMAKKLIMVKNFTFLIIWTTQKDIAIVRFA